MLKTRDFLFSVINKLLIATFLYFDCGYYCYDISNTNYIYYWMPAFVAVLGPAEIPPVDAPKQKVRV